MTTFKYGQDESEYDTETVKLLLLSILDEHGPITVDSERFRNMGGHRSWALKVAPADEKGRMSVSVTWR